MSVPLSLSKNDSFLFAWAFRAQEKKKKNWNEDERYRCVALLCFRRSLLVVSKELSLLTGWVLKEGLSQDLPKQNKTKKSGIWRTLTSNLTATYLAPPYDAHSVLSFNLPRYPWAKKALNPYQLHAINRNDPAGIGGSQTEKERNWLYKTKDHSSSPSTGFALSLHLQYISSKNGYPEKKNPCSLGRSLVFFLRHSPIFQSHETSCFTNWFKKAEVVLTGLWCFQQGGIHSHRYIWSRGTLCPPHVLALIQHSKSLVYYWFSNYRDGSYSSYVTGEESVVSTNFLWVDEVCVWRSSAFKEEVSSFQACRPKVPDTLTSMNKRLEDRRSRKVGEWNERREAKKKMSVREIKSRRRIRSETCRRRWEKVWVSLHKLRQTIKQNGVEVFHFRDCAISKKARPKNNLNRLYWIN